jgi:hypothetical protein
MKDVTMVITSSGRLDLLRRTIDSFKRHNTYPISKYILIEDSGRMNNAVEIRKLYPSIHLIANVQNIGQVKSIDTAYSEVKTEYIFHCENDWEFQQGGFIEKSMSILETDAKILTVWLRGPNDTNGQPVEMQSTYSIYNTELDRKITDYYLMSTHYQTFWHGFTWNPGLRRLADYKSIAPFSSFLQPGDFAALTECRIGQKYFDMGFRAAILPEQYVRHIG